MKAIIHHTTDGSRAIGIEDSVPAAVKRIEAHSGREVPAYNLVLGLPSQECYPVGTPEGEWYEIRHVLGDVPELTERTYVFGVGLMLLRSVTVEAGSLEEANKAAWRALDERAKATREGAPIGWHLVLLAGPQGEVTT